jgi:glycosyltransferase involved in cell wall biosynthesis
MERVAAPERRLRVLHAIHDFLPRHRAGSELYTLALCQALAARHDVSVLCADYDPARTHGELVWRVYEGLPVVEIVNNWAGGTFAHSYRSPEITRRLEQVLDALQPDLLHLHSVLNLSFELPARARQRGIPVVATLHDYTLVCPSGGQRLHRAESHVCHDIDVTRCARCFRESDFYRLMTVAPLAGQVARSALLQRAVAATRSWAPRALIGAADSVRWAQTIPVTSDDVARRLEHVRDVFDSVDLFVAPSASMAGEFQRLGLDASKIRVSDYGFARLGGAPRRRRDQVLRVGFVGTVVWHKGVHVLLSAARRLPADAFELLIFGDLDTFPEYVAGLRRSAAGLPVRFPGRFEAGQAADVYAQMDVLVVPSLWLENSPLVIHEAFMCGVPVVGARIGGIAGLIDHGVNGLLYDPGSDEALAAALARILDDPSQLDRWRTAAPAMKSIDDDAEEWIRIYQTLLASRAAAVGVG